MQVTSVRTIANTKDGCSSMSGSQELISLSGEYGKHLPSLVLTGVNYIPISNSSFLLFFNNIFSINFHDYFYEPMDLFDGFINLICQSCNSCSEGQCTCTCICEPECKGNFICICVSNCSGDKAGNCVCICVCKKKDSCKCITICICDKDGQTCPCTCGTVHCCQKSFVKIDIKSILSNTSKIVIYLRWIRCCISRLENQTCQSTSNIRCCCCSCCEGRCEPNRCCSYCCCKDPTINYSSIISRIHWIELLFKEVGTKISDLRTFKNILSIANEIAIKCPKCPEQCCNDKIDSLIKNIQKSLKYYSSFRSRIKDIRSFVEYKFNYNKSKQIISSLEKSVNPLSKQLQLINNKIVGNVDYTRTSDQLLVCAYSQYSVIQCYVLISNLIIFSSKLSIALYINQIVENCSCVYNFKENGNSFKTTDFWKYVSGTHKNNRDELKKLVLKKDGNHSCLCLVIKYILYPNLIKSVYYLRGLYLTAIDKQTREFTPRVFNDVQLNEVTKMLNITINLMYKISTFMEYRYLWPYSKIKMILDIVCFCRAPEDIYYPYLVSTILFMSSLIENIWSMDPESVKMATDKMSNLYAQLKSYDFNTIDDSKVCCNPVYSLIVHKECKQQLKDKCCCCWCVTCYNLLIICISLCHQFKLFNSLCKKEVKKKGNGCEEWKDFCTVEDCKCLEGQGVCCLLKLALSSALPCDEELKKKLEECCKECRGAGDCCCKKLAEKASKGNCKVLLLGCQCNCTPPGNDVKVKCVFFNNPWGCTSIAVVVFCKCPKTPNECCCLIKIIEKLKDKLDKICKDGQCVCEDLKTICKDICGSECEKQSPCKELEETWKKICQGDSGNCLCKQIKDTISNSCVDAKKKCKCKDKEGCCNCPCCKVLRESVRILSKACRQNVLEPYNRIVLDLVSSSETKRRRTRTILVNINRSMVKKISLCKNYNTNVSSIHDDLTDISSVRNWGYDTHFEHSITTPNSFSDGDGYPNLTYSDRTGCSGSKMFKLVLSRLLVATIVVFMFIYLRLIYNQFIVIDHNTHSSVDNVENNLYNITENTNIGGSSYLVDMLLDN